MLVIIRALDLNLVNLQKNMSQKMSHKNDIISSSDKADFFSKKANESPLRTPFNNLTSEAVKELFQLAIVGLDLLHRPHIGGCFQSQRHLLFLMHIKVQEILRKPTSIKRSIDLSDENSSFPKTE